MTHAYKILVHEDEAEELQIIFEVRTEFGHAVSGQPLTLTAAPRGYAWFRLSPIKGEMNYISAFLSRALPQLEQYTHAHEWPENRIFQDLIWSWSADDKRPTGRPMSVAVSYHMYDWWHYLKPPDRMHVLGHITNQMQRMYQYVGLTCVDQVQVATDGTLLRLECRGNQTNGLVLQTDGIDGVADVTPAVFVAHNVDYIDQQLVLLAGVCAFEECYEQHCRQLREVITEESSA